MSRLMSLALLFVLVVGACGDRTVPASGTNAPKPSASDGGYGY